MQCHSSRIFCPFHLQLQLSIHCGSYSRAVTRVTSVSMCLTSYRLVRLFVMWQVAPKLAIQVVSELVCTVVAMKAFSWVALADSDLAFLCLQCCNLCPSFCKRSTYCLYRAVLFCCSILPSRCFLIYCHSYYHLLAFLCSSSCSSQQPCVQSFYKKMQVPFIFWSLLAPFWSLSVCF